MEIQLDNCPVCGHKIVEKYDPNNGEYYYACSNFKCFFKFYERSSQADYALQGRVLSGKCVKCGSPLIVVNSFYGLYARCLRCKVDVDSEHKWINAKDINNITEINKLKKEYMDSINTVDDDSWDDFNDEYDDYEINTAKHNENMDKLENLKKGCIAEVTEQNEDKLDDAISIHVNIKRLVLRLFNENLNKAWTCADIEKELINKGYTIKRINLNASIGSLKNKGIIKIVGGRRVRGRVNILYQLSSSSLNSVEEEVIFGLTGRILDVMRKNLNKAWSSEELKEAITEQKYSVSKISSTLSLLVLRGKAKIVGNRRTNGRNKAYKLYQLSLSSLELPYKEDIENKKKLIIDIFSHNLNKAWSFNDLIKEFTNRGYDVNKGSIKYLINCLTKLNKIRVVGTKRERRNQVVNLYQLTCSTADFLSTQNKKVDEDYMEELIPF